MEENGKTMVLGWHNINGQWWYRHIS